MLTWKEKNEMIDSLAKVLDKIHEAHAMTNSDVEKVALILDSMEQSDFFLCEEEANEAEEAGERIYDWDYAYDMAWNAVYEPSENVIGFMWKY